MAVANLPEGISLGPSGGLVVTWAPEGPAAAGRCRVCGCTDGNACVLAPEIIEGDGAPLTCRWVDPSRTLCSNPRCVAEIPLAELEALCSLEPAS